MANAIALVTIPDARYTWSDGSKYYAIGNVTVSASPSTYVTGGIVMNMFVPLVKASRTPMMVTFVDQSGYSYTYVPGADASSGLLKIFQSAGALAPQVEIPAAAIPAAVSSDTIIFEATWFGME